MATLPARLYCSGVSRIRNLISSCRQHDSRPLSNVGNGSRKQPRAAPGIRRIGRPMLGLLERVYPQLFGRPDLQLSVNQSVSTGPTNVVVMGPERARVLATRYEQIRAKTRELLDAPENNGKSPKDG